MTAKKQYVRKFENPDPMDSPEMYGMEQVLKNVIRNFLPVSLDLDVGAESLGINMSVSAELNIDETGVFFIIDS